MGENIDIALASAAQLSDRVAKLRAWAADAIATLQPAANCGNHIAEGSIQMIRTAIRILDDADEEQGNG
jgi:hypothetical protein